MNRLAYSLPTTMSSITGNEFMDLLYLLKDTFKNLLFDLLIIGRNFENLSYLSNCSLSRRWRFWRIRSNVLWGIKSGFAYTKYRGRLAKVSGSPRKSIGVASQYVLWSGSLWYTVRSSMLKNKRYFSFLISEFTPAFSTVQLDVAKNHIN